MTSHYTTHMVKMWEHLDGEDPEEWSAFVLYRDDRKNLNEIAEIRSISLSRVQTWARDYRWRDRLAAYDEHLGSITTKAAEREAAKRGRKAVDVVNRLLDLSVSELEHALAASENRMRGDERAILTPAALMRSAQLAVTLQRLLAGESTENVTVQAVDVTKLSTADLEQLDALRRKAKGEG